MLKLLDAMKSGPAWLSDRLPKMSESGAEKRELLGLLDESVLFHGVPQATLLNLVQQSMRISLKQGEQLLAPGMQNEYVYVILAGQLSVHLVPENADQPIALLNAGDCVGEMSVLMNSDVSAWVAAESDCQLLAIGYSTFWQLLKGSNEAALNMVNILVKRIRAGNEAITQSRSAGSAR